jgi:ankyrin repeat protein
MSHNKQAQVCMLYLLPRELRTIIYEILAVGVVIKFKSHNVYFTNASIMATCQQAAEETRQVFFRVSKVEFHDSDSLVKLITSKSPTIKLIGSNPNTRILEEPRAYRDEVRPYVRVSCLGELDIVKGLLHGQNDPKELSDMLWVTCEKNAFELAMAVVEKMVSLGVDKNAYKHGLCQSVRYGHYILFETMLSVGAELDKEPEYRSWNQYGLHPIQSGVPTGNPLVVGCCFGQYGMVERLLDVGANIHASSERCINGLATACHYGHMDIVELLLTRGADLDGLSASGYNSRSALEAAAENGQEKIFHMLLSRGATLTLVREEGDMFYRACEGGSISILETLLNYGPDLKTTYQNKTYLEAAVGHNRTGVIRWMLQNGVEVDLEGVLGLGSALKVACRCGNLPLTSVLLEAGADINVDITQSTTEYESALQLAAKHGHLHIIKLLIQRRAAINAVGYYGTALTCAAKFCRLDIVEYLLDHAADVNQPGGIWLSPLDAVLSSSDRKHKHKNPAILMCLLRRGAIINPEHRSSRVVVEDKTSYRTLKDSGLYVELGLTAKQTTTRWSCLG